MLFRSDPVPTGIARVGDEYFVTLFGGCPYPDGVGRLVAIDGERGESIVADGLTMPIDVAVDEAGTVWVLEFARFEEGASCFSGEGYQPGTGRLSRLVDGELEPVAEGIEDSRTFIRSEIVRGGELLKSVHFERG